MLKEVNVIATTGVGELGHMLMRLDNATPRAEENDLDQRGCSGSIKTVQTHIASIDDDAAMTTSSGEGPITPP